MPFTSMKLKPESGANRISSADDAYSFLAHLRLSYQSKPHWRAVRHALDNVFRLTKAKTGRGRLSGLQCPLKTGSQIEPLAAPLTTGGPGRLSVAPYLLGGRSLTARLETNSVFRL
jgi:hypothetical protein